MAPGGVLYGVAAIRLGDVFENEPSECRDGCDVALKGKEGVENQTNLLSLFGNNEPGEVGDDLGVVLGDVLVFFWINSN